MFTFWHNEKWLNRLTFACTNIVLLHIKWCIYIQQASARRGTWHLPFIQLRFVCTNTVLFPYKMMHSNSTSLQEQTLNFFIHLIEVHLEKYCFVPCKNDAFKFNKLVQENVPLFTFPQQGQFFEQRRIWWQIPRSCTSYLAPLATTICIHCHIKEHSTLVQASSQEFWSLPPSMCLIVQMHPSGDLQVTCLLFIPFMDRYR